MSQSHDDFLEKKFKKKTKKSFSLLTSFDNHEGSKLSITTTDQTYSNNKIFVTGLTSSCKQWSKGKAKQNITK